jgi:hypothetical protein
MLYLSKIIFDVVLSEMSGIVPELLLVADQRVKVVVASELGDAALVLTRYLNTAVIYWNAALDPSLENTTWVPCRIR